MKRCWIQPSESKYLKVAERAAKGWCLSNMPGVGQPDHLLRLPREGRTLSPPSQVRLSLEQKPKCGFCLLRMNPFPHLAAPLALWCGSFSFVTNQFSGSIVYT